MIRRWVVGLMVLALVGPVRAAPQTPADVQRILQKAQSGKPLTAAETARLQQFAQEMARAGRQMQDAGYGKPKPARPGSRPTGTGSPSPFESRQSCTVHLTYTIHRTSKKDGQNCNGDSVPMTVTLDATGKLDAQGYIRRSTPAGPQGPELFQVSFDGNPGRASGSGESHLKGDVHPGDKVDTAWHATQAIGTLTLASSKSRGDNLGSSPQFAVMGNTNISTTDECATTKSLSSPSLGEALGYLQMLLNDPSQEQFYAMGGSRNESMDAARAMAAQLGIKLPPVPTVNQTQIAAAKAQAWSKWQQDHFGKFSMSHAALSRGMLSRGAFIAQATATGSQTTPDGQMSGSLTMTISVGQVPLDLVVNPIGYAQWRPWGGADEKTAGNTLTVEAALLTPDGKAPPAGMRAKQITFELAGVSNEPGVCLNQPTSNAQTSPDLGFDPKQNPRLTVNGSFAETKQPGTRATAVISSYDWGAYGVLKVTAKMENGDTLHGYLMRQKGTTDILLPKRDKSSHIADVWKTSNKIFGQADTADAEPQAGNKNNGDGLTLYEEYRGIKARGQRERLDPNKKDLIVENTIGDWVREGIDLFTRESKIRAVELKKDELPASRQVNANHDTAHGGDQFGLRITQGSVGGGSSAAAALPAIEGKTPKDCTELRVDSQMLSAIFNNKPPITATVRATLRAFLPVTIAHELAHGVYVEHHGKHTNFHKTVLQRNPPQVFDANGQEILTRPFTLDEETVGYAHEDASGDVNCLMAYNNAFRFFADKQTTPYTYYQLATLPEGTTFCTSPKGTGRNANDQMFGDAAPGYGNCMSRFKVKDW